MSGHSKWATIKHKKGAADARRGRLFTKLIKEITIAARMGGGDPNGNPRLRTAVAAAKNANMPSDNIERAVKKGTGELEGVSYEDCTYEGFGPAGVAIMVEAVTDNKNRTTSELRKIWEKFNGNMGVQGCVTHMFTRRGRIQIEPGGKTEDDIMADALDVGAEDVLTEDAGFVVYTKPNPNELNSTKESLEKKGWKIAEARLSMIPQNYVDLQKKEAESMLKLVEALEEHDDVQNVYANFDISDEILRAIEQTG
ncbi:MAG: YebC/PmpR family DNA-binding transcriptional regulator [Deltaproteobacteria bacterium]|nr:YebC/PmpR family DNA-binding transcriptional regulator [Deltaproteobacteria bacterium]